MSRIDVEAQKKLTEQLAEALLAKQKYSRLWSQTRGALLAYWHPRGDYVALTIDNMMCRLGDAVLNESERAQAEKNAESIGLSWTELLGAVTRRQEMQP